MQINSCYAPIFTNIYQQIVKRRGSVLATCGGVHAPGDMVLARKGKILVTVVGTSLVYTLTSNYVWSI